MELTNQDIMTFYTCSQTTATQRKIEIMSFFKLPTHVLNNKGKLVVNPRRILSEHLAKYEGLPHDQVLSIVLE